jgi:AcrR family transcriptional regulator
VPAATTSTGILSSPDRDRILQAMADSCAERGYSETTIGAVVESAGVSRDSFDSHFADKEDCALAALNKIISETLTAVSMADGESLEPERRMLQIKAIVELMFARPSYARLGFIQARQGATQRAHDSYASAAHVLALMMERVPGSGAGPPAGAARAALGGAEAVVRRELAARRDRRLQELLPDFVYAALVPFVGQKEALRQSRVATELVAEEG